MKIKCMECGAIVIEGKIGDEDKNKFYIGLDKPQGTILKNNSSNPKNWEGLCSKCQTMQSHGGVKK